MHAKASNWLTDFNWRVNMRFSSTIKSVEQVAKAACEHGFALGMTRLFKMKKIETSSQRY
jgi:hypothetical protein